jgi:phage-related protein
MLFGGEKCGSVQAERNQAPKSVKWVGNSRRVVQSFPEEVKDNVGTALFWAQKGSKHPDAKALKGFGDAQVIEIVENYDGDTYRAIYTVRIAEVVYVLHAFQKKSKKEGRTSKGDIALIRKRLKFIESLHER